MPAAPEPGESAVTAQAPAAAFVLQVGAAPPPGAPGSRGRLVSAALAFRPSSCRPRAAGRSPPSSDGTLAEATAAGASAGRPRGTSLLGGLWASCARLRAQFSQGRRRPTSARAFAGAGAAWGAEPRGLRGRSGACPQGARRASPVQGGCCPRVLSRAGGSRALWGEGDGGTRGPASRTNQEVLRSRAWRPACQMHCPGRVGTQLFCAPTRG